MKKGSPVTYEANGGTVRGTILRLHRDGTATIEAKHYLDENDLDKPGYLGDKFRLPLSRLTLRTFPGIEAAFARDAERQLAKKAAQGDSK